MNTAVIYARYSSHNQTEMSIEGQLRDCRAFAEREGYTIVNEYVDRALTGTTDERPDFLRMIADTGKKKFGYILVWKLDRFSRNRYDSAMYKAALRKNGVKVVSVTERISDDPEGIILEGMLESMAEFYSANLSKHVKRGHREAALAGHVPNGVLPYGYKLIDKLPVIDDETAPFIKYAFEQYADGVSKREIMESLKNKGVKNIHGGELTYSSFQAALKNPKYYGECYYSDIKIEFPAIIDKELFDRVQARLAIKSHAPAAAKAKVEYLLSGKCYCGMCGANVIAESGKSRQGIVHHYYACSAKKKKHTCGKSNEKKNFLEWYVCEQTIDYVLNDTRIQGIAQVVSERHEKEFDADEIKRLEREIVRINNEINTVVSLLIKSGSDSLLKAVEAKINELDMRKTDMEIDLCKLQAAANIHITPAEVVAWLRLYCKGDLFDIEFRRNLIDTFINSVYIYDDKIVIFYNIKGACQTSEIEPIDLSEVESSGFEFGGAFSDFVNYVMLKYLAFAGFF